MPTARAVPRRRFLRDTGMFVAASAIAEQVRGNQRASERLVGKEGGGSNEENRQAVVVRPSSDFPIVAYMVYGRDHMDLVDQIAALGESGFRGVGFHTAPSLAPFRAFDPFRASPNAIDRLRRVLAGFKKIEVHGPFSDWDVSLVSPNSTVRSASLGELKQHIDFAAHIGASVFTAHPGKTSAPVPPEEQLDRLRESLQQLAEIAEARGFLVCVETADILANTSNLRCFEGIQCPYLGITMDTGHISFHPPGTKPGYAPHSSIEEFVQAWGRHIKHVHVNDYNSERDHIGIGQGELPLKGVLGALHRVGYQGFFDMEVDPVVVPAKDMPVERDLLERLIAETWNDASQGRS